MEFDVKQFISTGEDGVTQVDSEALNKALQSYVDSQVSKGVESYKKNAESAKQKDKTDFEAQIKALNLKYNRAECKSLFSDDSFSQKEKDLLLESLVDEDLAGSQSRINAFVAERKSANEKLKKDILDSLKQGAPSTGTTATEPPVEPKKPKQNPQNDREKTLNYYKA